MRTGQELILATKPYATDLSRKSWSCILSTTLLLALALAGTFWNVHPLGKLACSVLSGFLLLRLFVIYHDQQHHAILPRSRVAEWFMRTFGILGLSASSVWRSSHNHHHNHNSKLRGSHIGSFPIMTTAQYESSSPSQRFAYLATRHPLTIFFGYFSMFLYGMCIQPFINDPKKHWDCLLALLVHVGLGAALVVFWGWQQLLLTQTLPHFILYAIGSYLFYAQHNFPAVTMKEKGGWTYEGAALESSSFLETSRIMAWFMANIGYHHVHHLNAKIPFYRLPEVMREMPELQNPRTTSLHPLEIARCLRLKLWDGKLERMISLQEMTPASSPAKEGASAGSPSA